MNTDHYKRFMCKLYMYQHERVQPTRNGSRFDAMLLFAISFVKSYITYYLNNLMLVLSDINVCYTLLCSVQ